MLSVLILYLKKNGLSRYHNTKQRIFKYLDISETAEFQYEKVWEAP